MFTLRSASKAGSGRTAWFKQPFVIAGMRHNPYGEAHHRELKQIVSRWAAHPH